MSPAGPNSPAAHHAYCFSGFVLDLERETLLRDGAEIRLRPKAYEMLRCLAAHAQALVTKEQLLETVWPDIVVTESSLSQCLAEIRRALGDEHKTLVRTVPRRGLILDAPVTEQVPAQETIPRSVTAAVDGPSSEGHAPPPADVRGAAARPAGGNAAPADPAAVAPGGNLRPAGETGPEPARTRRDAGASRWRMVFPLAVAAIGLGLWWALPDREGNSAAPASASVSGMLPMSVAVLPFADLSADGDHEWFGDGMAEEIINLLVRADELQVIARTSSFSFKDRPGITIENIAEALNVTYVLEGSVRRHGDRIRVTAQLIDTADSTHVWSRTYDESLGDLFVTQTAIAEAVADALQVHLDDAGAGDSLARPVDARSFQRSLEGRHFYHRRAAGDLDRALECFEDAVAMDPGNAAAWMYLAGVYGVKINTAEISSGDGLPPMAAAIERALSLAPDDAEVQARAARHAVLLGDTDRAWRHMHRARELDPDNWLVLGGYAGQALGNLDFDTALRLQRRAAELDPLSPLVRGNLAGFLLAAGRYEEAEAEALAVAALSPSRAGAMARIQADSLLLRDRPAEALAVLEDHRPDSRNGLSEADVGWISSRAMALHALGRSREAQTELRRLAEAPAAMARMGEARFHGFTGDPDGAFAALDRVVAGQSIAGETGQRSGVNFSPLRASPFLASLHDDPRWARFLEVTGTF